MTSRFSSVTRVMMAVCLLAACAEAADPSDDAPAPHLDAATDLNPTGAVGTAVTAVPSVRATDRAGRPVPGVEVAFRVSGGGAIGRGQTRTDATGVASVEWWTLGIKPGLQTVTARTDDGQSVVFTATAITGPPGYFQQVKGSGQSGTVGEALAEPLTMQVFDGFGNPIIGLEVWFSVASGGGTITPDRVVTNVSGYAESGPWILGTTEGIQEVWAHAGEIKVRFTAVACPLRCANVTIAYERGGEIFGLGPDQVARQLTTGAGTAADPAWSPNGRRLAFTRYDTSGPSILLRDEFGATVRKIRGFAAPSWSPNGQWLAVQDSRNSLGCVYECTIYLLPVEDDGEPPMVLVSGAAWPAWSPDGRQIAFVALSGDDGHHTLDVINRDGSGRRRITQDDGGAIGRPAWSPDGSRIAFSKCLGAACRVYTVDAAATETAEIAVLTDAEWVSSPAWSPDGQTIAVTIEIPGSSIAIIPATGGPPQVIAFPGRNPSWRGPRPYDPDGSPSPRIATSSNRVCCR